MVRRYLRLYKILWCELLKDRMSYRGDFLISIVVVVFSTLYGLCFWKMLFSNVNEIAGWNYYQLMFIYAFSLIAISLSAIFLENNSNLKYYVYSGEFIKYCTKPLNPFIYFYSEGFGIDGVSQLLLGVLVISYSMKMLNIKLTIAKLMVLIIYLMSASFTMSALLILASSSCFWLINSGIIILVVDNMKEFAKYPAKIYNRFFQLIFSLVIPIAFVGFYPSTIFINKDISVYSYLVPFWGVFFFLFSYKIWCYGAKQYSGTGS